MVVAEPVVPYNAGPSVVWLCPVLDGVPWLEDVTVDDPAGDDETAYTLPLDPVKS